MRKENLAKTALVGAEASTKVTLFTSSEFGTVRTTVIDDEPWFVGKDVASALGYSNTKDALSRHVGDDDKQGSCFTTSGQSREMTPSVADDDRGVQNIDTPSGKLSRQFTESGQGKSMHVDDDDLVAQNSATKTMFHYNYSEVSA